MKIDHFEITKKGTYTQYKSFAAKRLKTGDEWIHGLTIERDISGGMGAVYVLCSQADKRYILKTFAEGMLPHREIAARFFNEVEILLSLENHDNIVKTDGVVTWNDAPCVLLEYFDGKTLRARLDESVLGIQESLRFALQLCDGMMYIGDTKHIIHRDIKPENILINQNGMLKIIDFGLAKISLRGTLDVITNNESSSRINGESGFTPQGELLPPTDWRITRLKQVIGTPDYAAPEIFERSDNASLCSDIYSTGLILVEMLTGRRLREGLSLREKRAGRKDWPIAERHLAEKRISESIQKIVSKCLEDYPKHRFQNFDELRNTLNYEYKTIVGTSFPYGRIRPRSSIDTANLSASLSKLGRFEDALTILGRALESNPSDALCLNQLAMCQFALNRKDEAFSTIDRACNSATDPFMQSFVWQGKAHLFSCLKEHEKALICLDTAINAKSDDAETWALKANALRQLDQIDEAIICFEQSIALDNTNESIWPALGECYRKLEKYEKAIACFDRALKLKPDCTKLGVNKALCLALSKRVNEARDIMFDLCQKNPTDPEVRTAFDCLFTEKEKNANKVQTLIAKGNFEKAIKVADEIIKRNEGDADIWHNRGIALETIGKYKDAVKSYDKSLQLVNDNDIVHVNKGNAIDKMGQPKEALCSYDLALAINPLSVGALVNKAVCLLKLRRISEAIECCEKATQLEPDSYMGWRILGIVLHEIGQNVESRICLENALRINPNDAAAWTAKAGCEMDMFLHEEALESLVTSLELEPESWRSWANVAQAMRVMGRKDDAIIYLKKAAEQSKTNPELWAQLGALVLDCAFATPKDGSDTSINIEWFHDALEYIVLANQYDNGDRFLTLLANGQKMIPIVWQQIIDRTLGFALSGHAKDAILVVKEEERKYRGLGKKLMLALVLTNQAILLSHGMNRHDDAKLRAEEAYKLVKQTGPREAVDIVEGILHTIPRHQ